MTKLPRSRGPSCDAESISSSITGCCPPAPTPFRYLTASSEVTRYQHPSFRSMELLLPASLWSDSFVQERARYTLLPRHLSQFSSPSASTTLMPSSSSARDSTPSTTAALVTTQEEQRRTSSADVDNCLSGRAPGRWSFMTIYRNFKRAREEAATWVKTPEMSRRDCLADNAPEGNFFSERPYRPSTPPILSLSSPSMSPVDGCSTTEVDDGDNYGEEVIVQGRGLSSSCPSSSTTSRAESMGAAAWYSTAAAVASEVNIQNTMLHGYQVTQSSFPATAGVAATSLTAEHAEAFRVFEIVLDRVSTAHATRCPLCSPPRPPRWGRGAQLALPPTARTPDAMPPIYPDQSRAMVSEMWGARKFSTDVERQAAMVTHRQHLLQRACSLLNRHDDRLLYLSETKPALFKEAVECHPMVRACADLGGLPLLRVLSATL
ncbi:conserved hypothetical protein [Leishmania braziliensis MHOM/BR/75/M2904]|uniref:Uncharacterized protein n=2 Tax=Leishmania braziliensis TaxID=5660 RepID=A4H855_LEIBR|nr:conserved hypothetical protein [Leishmania braziliensis MHOM/BR/75/M2904]CAJ2469399.1 unnamed protein product [Leishmania braziliensis]CAJ2469895.1 unnamed protein product [Leishmania braziliensis]CAM42103.1 conserved hypothetical protein [Leishmania braziliensis MHOM/BR/75/M2904]SYZ64221.1 hypothetical_protein [Leishmania braziliensis MHOM/BR/75/M2904]